MNQNGFLNPMENFYGKHSVHQIVLDSESTPLASSLLSLLPFLEFSFLYTGSMQF